MQKHVTYCITDKTADELAHGLNEFFGKDVEATFVEADEPELGYRVVVGEKANLPRCVDFAEGFFYALSSRP